MQYYLRLFLFTFILTLLQYSAKAQLNRDFNQAHLNQTATYHEFIAFLEDVTNRNKHFEINTFGRTDSGYPLHVISLIPQEETKIRLLINNNIHPGESDGIEATIKLIQDFAGGKVEVPKHTQIHIVACYNIGGMLNRNSTTRINQNGPESYGFRGNARNFDLNRDFIKADTKNTFAFYELFHTIDPDVFIDNHVSNGADYQYTLTYLFSQHNKLGGPLADYQESHFIPKLTNQLIKKNIPSTPYVNVFNQPPNYGFSQFLDTPRYSSGFTSLWNNISFMIETHMLKNYQERVEVTYQTLLESILFLEEEHQVVKQKRKAQEEFWTNQSHYPIGWKLDSTEIKNFNFKGFHHSYEKSEVTGLKRLKYHRNQPQEFNINYLDTYQPSKKIEIPSYYIIPKAWEEVINRLKANHIQMFRVTSDSITEITQTKIENYETINTPYEGHYLHYNTKTSEKNKEIKLNEGDVLVPTKQKGIKYLIETLEPEAVDSFFNWNFFDSILQRKEGFSPYVFEEKALEILQSNSDLKKRFQMLKKNDKEFANSAYAQLNWIYEASGIQEKEYMTYPIFKIY